MIIVELINRPEYDKAGSGNVIVVTDEKDLMIRYLLIINPQNSNQNNNYYHKNFYGSAAASNVFFRDCEAMRDLYDNHLRNLPRF